MNIDKDFFEETLKEFYRRSKICRKYGISERDRVDGAPIPPGWTLDFEMDYWMPPTLLES